MFNIILLAATTTAPSTLEWTPNVALVMIVCNIVAIIIGKYGIQQQNSGPQLPAPAFFGNMGVPALLATTSFGHLIGAGVILGLANLGVL